MVPQSDSLAHLKRRFLSSASIVCLTVGLTAALPTHRARAEPAPVPGIVFGKTTLSVEGGLAIPDSDNTASFREFDEKFGDLRALDEGENGLFLGGAITTDIDRDWDVRGALRWQRFTEDEQNGIAPFNSNTDVTATSRSSLLSLDLEAGYTIPMQAGALRLFAGPRFVRSTSDIEYGYTNTPDDKLGDFDHENTLWGIGPRAGFSATVPLDQGFSFNVAAAGSILFSQVDRKVRFFYDNGNANDTAAFTREDDRTVYNADVSVSIGFAMSERANFEIGYRAEKWWNLVTQVQDADEFGDFNESEGDSLSHGPFARITIELD